jgi:hypothetical protein
MLRTYVDCLLFDSAPHAPAQYPGDNEVRVVFGTRGRQDTRRQRNDGVSNPMCCLRAATAASRSPAGLRTGRFFQTWRKALCQGYPIQLWAADITSIVIAVGFVYLAAILDVWSRASLADVSMLAALRAASPSAAARRLHARLRSGRKYAAEDCFLSRHLGARENYPPVPRWISIALPANGTLNVAKHNIGRLPAHPFA